MCVICCVGDMYVNVNVLAVDVYRYVLKSGGVYICERTFLRVSVFVDVPLYLCVCVPVILDVI